MRAWEIRQRDRASGAWFRLGHLLARAGAAYAISAEDADFLEARGIPPEEAGLELEPAIACYLVPEEILASLADPRPLALHLDAALLCSRRIALIPFDTSDRPNG